MSHTRFAIFYVPPPGPLADFGAAWLGWDIAQGAPVRQRDVAGLREITDAPRKYGFHGTLKPPFRLAEGQTIADLREAVRATAATVAPAMCDGLELARLGRFLALVPVGDTAALRRVATACVRDLDRFRAAPTEAERARRRAVGLSARQDALLVEWGYPYVMDEFRFHLTLSRRLDDDLAHWAETVQTHLPALPSPFAIEEIALCGERPDGQFEVLDRVALTG